METQDSSIRKQFERKFLPNEHINSAIILCGELAWPKEVAILTVTLLKEKGIAVTGVEYWEKAGDSPRWLASSKYEIASVLSWPEYVRSCAEGAVDFIERFGHDKSALFNFTIAEENSR